MYREVALFHVSAGDACVLVGDSIKSPEMGSSPAAVLSPWW